MKVLIVEPGKYPREADIEHTLEAEQAVVGGTIEAVYPWRDSACIVCNDNGIAENLPLNRMLGDYDIIHGTFFVCGLTRDDFTDLTPKQMKHYEEMYHDPQLFFLLGKTLCVEHTTPEEYALLWLRRPKQKNPRSADMNITILARSPPAGFFLCPKSSNKQGEEPMNDIFENTETMQENEHPRFYTAESVMRGHPDKLCDLIADSVLDACLQHDPASRVACEVMATHGHIIVSGEITTSAKPDVFNIVRDTLRDVGYDPKGYQIDCYIHDQSPDIAGAVEPELAEGEDEDTLGAGDQGVMVGYACNETPEYLPMPVVAAQRLVTLLEISRMTGVIPDIGPDGKVQVTMEYNGDTPVRITTVVVSVQHKEDTDINKLADLLDEYVFPLAFDGMPADDAEIILNPSGKFVQGGPDADTGLTGRKLMVDSYGTFAPHGGGAFSGKDATKVDRSGAYMARYIAKNMVAAHLADCCQVTLAYAIGEKDPVMVDVNTFGTGICEDDCLAAAVRKVYDLTPAGIIKQLNLLNPIYSRTAVGGHFGREDFPWENIERMSDLAAYIV